MPPKRQSATSPAPAPVETPSKPTSKPTKSNPQPQSTQDILLAVWDKYLRTTPPRVKQLDAFLAFLVIVGGVQFVYCCLISSFPFNAFLSGFSACVGQFVLTVSLRIQTDPGNRAEFESGFSDERAFADFVFGSLILHFFCVNFIN